MRSGEPVEVVSGVFNQIEVGGQQVEEIGDVACAARLPKRSEVRPIRRDRLERRPDVKDDQMPGIPNSVNRREGQAIEHARGIRNPKTRRLRPHRTPAARPSSFGCLATREFFVAEKTSRECIVVGPEKRADGVHLS
jgi:hypothetical protein